MKLISINPFSCLPLLLIFILASCSKKEKINLSEFQIANNHVIELVAAEPDVILPVTMIEDHQNRFWVVEMPGYMRDIDGSDEDLADGRIVILSDSDKDGKFDQRKIFLDSLLNPRALCFVNNGLLYSDGTMLKWTETKSNKPNKTIIVDSFYVVGGNIEHQPNGLLYNLDNWIYSAKSNARYRIIDGKWKKEATSFRGQWGMSMDRMGRLIYNHNSAPLISDFALPNQNLDNPYLELKESIGKYLTDDMRIYPIQATSVNRGYQPEVLDSTGKVINYTSASSPHIFYGNNMENGYQKSAFVCAPEGNLISNYTYDENSLSSTRNLGKHEFLISKDESFRPVNLLTGYDGCLYIVDMRKGIIQHTAYMSSYLRENITSKGLDKINGKGRIYRIRKKDNIIPPINTTDANTEVLLRLLAHTNLQLRMFAQKKLIVDNDKTNISRLLTIAQNSDNTNAQIHALWTLEGMSVVEVENILAVNKSTKNPDVLAQLIILSKRFPESIQDFDELYQKSFNINSKQLDFLLASAIGKSAKFDKLWFQLAKKYDQDPILCESLASSIQGRESFFLLKLDPDKNAMLVSVISEVITNKKEDAIQSPILLDKPFDDDRTNGLKKYKSYCAACHGLDGKGQKNVAPSLKSSDIINGDESSIASIILNGYSSEKSIYKISMPAYKEDKNMTDQDIVDLISYLKSTFTSDWSSLKVEDVKAMRDE